MATIDARNEHSKIVIAYSKQLPNLIKHPKTKKTNTPKTAHKTTQQEARLRPSKCTQN